MPKLELDGLPRGEHPQIDDLESLFLNDVPLLDVRAPVEFEQGAFPNAVNIPLMTNVEREAVGIRYKEQGQDAAILLGAELVSEPLREERKRQWTEFFEQSLNKGGGALYCFRGGLRSQISQQWVLDHSEIDQPRVSGGYKAMRRFLIETIERIASQIPIVILGGRTGSGKTKLLNKLENSIDLEGLANHRGSAFGPTATPQPTPINFENALAIELLKKEAAGCQFLVIEDEARNVGSLGVPQALYEAMQKPPIVMLDVSQEQRNQVSINEYIVDTQNHFNQIYGDEKGREKLSEHLLNSLEKIQKRLGGERYQQAKEQMHAAIKLRHDSDSLDGFIPIVKTLLIDYYDPMYDYQSEKKKHRVCFTGDVEEVSQYLESPALSDLLKL